MNRKSSIISLLLIAVLVSIAAAQGPRRKSPARSQAPNAVPGYKTLKYPPLNQIAVPQPVRFEMANGIVVYLVEDHELPMVNLTGMIRTGSRWEPVEKAGIAAITGSVLRTGGTKTRNGDQLDEQLDRLGARIETGIDEDSGVASMTVLREDVDSGLDILADLLQNPAFPEDKIDIAKMEQRDAIARRNDDATDTAVREFRRVLFGKDSPYGHQPEYDTINSITRADLVAFHSRFFQPENLMIGIYGDFKSDEMRAKIEKAFGGWARGSKPKPAVPELESMAGKAGVYYVKKDDVNQPWILMGHEGGRRSDPDYYALTMMNSILGEGFSSRLFSNVRSDLGLAYHVSSRWEAGWDRSGIFYAIGGTKSDTVGKMIDAIKSNIEKIRTSEVSDDELSRARDGIMKGMAFDYDSTGKIVNRLMALEYYGLPSDYLQQYKTNIEKVTKADVLRVAKQYLKPDQLAIVVLGKEKDFDRPLSTLGKVTPIDITIPQPRQAEIPAATPETIARGKQLLNRAVEGMGGAAFKEMKDFTQKGSMKIILPQGEMEFKIESIQKLPEKSLTRLVTPMGEMRQGFDGQVAWARSPQGTQETPADEAKKELLHDTVWVLLNIENPDITVHHTGSADVEGKKTEIVAITGKGSDRPVLFYIDPSTGLILKKAYTASLMGPPSPVEEMAGDYRDVKGVRVPFLITINRDGKKAMEMKVSESTINSNVDDSIFKK